MYQVSPRALPDVMKAILHIGTEKTGTTTIQEFLHDNRALLISHGVAYPRTPGLRNHRNLAGYAMNIKQVDGFIAKHGLSSPEKKRRWKAAFKTRLHKELDELDASVHTVIFSSEHLHSRLWGEAAIGKIKELLSPCFEEIKILVYLRRQDQLAVSSYSTKLKAGDTPSHILNPKVKCTNQYYNYYFLLKKWSSIFGKENINVRLFESGRFYHNDLISDFLMSTGMNENAQWSTPESLNEKLSWQSQRLIRRYNNRYPKFGVDGYNRLNDTVRNELLNKLEIRYPGAGELPTRGEAISFYSIFREDNQRVAREWFDQDHLFDEDFSVYPETKQKHSLSLLSILYCEFAVRLERYRQSRRSGTDAYL